MDEKFIGYSITVEYRQDLWLKIKGDDGAVVYVSIEDLGKFRGFINRLVNSINNKKFVEQAGDYEVLEDIYGAQGISDSVE